jgi:hypothetical protein
MMLNSESIPVYLYFGYLPTVDCSHPLESVGTAHPTDSGSHAVLNASCEATLVDTGMDIWRRAFREAMEQADSDRIHVLPLSGGLDSRAILGGLLENLQSRQIQAVTFGTPGTWDFDIGQQVARAAGVRWEGIDLSSEEWAWDTSGLVKTARQTEWPTKVFDAHVNRQVPEHFGAEAVYWSGFLGDPLSGSHLRPRDSTTWDEARRCFTRHNRLSLSVDLTPPGFEPERCLPPSPVGWGLPHRDSCGERSRWGKPHPTCDESLCYDEQLDLAVRQPCLVRPIVLPHGYEYRTPFLHPEWVRFILDVPRRCRQGQSLYKEILKTAYPRLFSLPVKTNLGLPLDAPWWRRQARLARLGIRGLARRIAPSLCYNLSPGLNYIDFDQAIRRRKDLRIVVDESIHDLRKRGVITWIDLEDIWQRHQRGHKNHGDALILLASLEINLKAQEEAAP